MTTTTTDRVEYILAARFADRVYDVRDGTVWVSGLNANCRTVAERMVRDLHTHGIPCGPIRDDDASRNGGIEFRFGNPVHGLSLHPEDENLPGHHAVGDDSEAFESSGIETPVAGAGGGGGYVLALAAAVTLAFVLGVIVGWAL